MRKSNVTLTNDQAPGFLSIITARRPVLKRARQRPGAAAPAANANPDAGNLDADQMVTIRRKPRPCPSPSPCPALYGQLEGGESADVPVACERQASAVAKCSDQSDIHRFRIDAVDLLTCANDRH
jgi:hypothetical protein